MPPWEIRLRALILVALMAFLNRLRGGGFILLPHRNLFFVAPLVGLAFYIYARRVSLALAVGAGYFAWGFRSWSLWIKAEFSPDIPVPQPDVRLFDFVAHHHWAPGFFLRHWVMMWPLELSLFWLIGGWRPHALIVAVAALLTASYAVGWRTGAVDGIAASEWIAGVVWGCYLIGLADLVEPGRSPGAFCPARSRTRFSKTA